jgi:hypothetical protein
VPKKQTALYRCALITISLLSAHCGQGNPESTEEGIAIDEGRSRAALNYYESMRLINYSQDSYEPGNGLYDWDFGHYKATCPNESAVTGISQFAGSPWSQHAVRCSRYRSMDLFYWDVTYASFSRDNLQLLTNGQGDQQPNPRITSDWAPWYHKLQCPKGKWVVGVSQYPGGSQPNKVHGLLCASGLGEYRTPDYSPVRSCQVFDMDYTSTGDNSSDWDPNRYKGTCPSPAAIAGVSFYSGGAIHSILCCFHSDY